MNERAVQRLARVLAKMTYDEARSAGYAMPNEDEGGEPVWVIACGSGERDYILLTLTDILDMHEPLIRRRLGVTP